MPWARRSRVQSYVVAILVVAVATAARGALDPLLGGGRVPFATYYVAIVAIALLGDLGPALVATGLAALIGTYLFVSPRFDISPDFRNSVSVALFLTTGGIVAVLASRMQQARSWLQRSADAEAEQRRILEAQRQRLHDIIDSIPGVVWESWSTKDRRVTAGNGRRVDFVSDYVKTMMGYTPEEWTSQPDFWLTRVHPDDRERAARVAAGNVESGKPGENEFRWITKAGREVWVIARSTGIRDEQGRPIGTRGVTVDITDRKEAERRLAALALENAHLMEAAHREADDARRARAEAEEAGRVKDEFLATLSHELRTPLHAILGWAHMLKDAQLPAERRQVAVDTIVRNAMSQEQLISDLLDLQRIMAGKIRLTIRPVDLGQIVRAAAETVQPTADVKQVRLQLLIDLDVPQIPGDAERLQQVVWNLLSNAIKFAPQNGRVEVRLLRDAECCQLIVEDNGPGISPEFLPHMFERFQQADSSTTRTHKGLGLGLTIVRSLVELHGGRITASNTTTPAATGAVFTIRLPRQSAQLAAGPVDETRIDREGRWTSEVPSLQDLAVLVVEDDRDGRELLQALLQQCGAEVTAVASVAEGMEAFNRRRFNVVVSDIEMPEEDGYSLIRQIRALPPERGGGVPAAALTAYASPSDRMKVLAAGFNIHVAKPVQPGELAVVVASLAGRRQ